MDASHWTAGPGERSSDSEWDSRDHRAPMSRRTRFPFTCDGLVRTVLDAADPSVPEWQPYRGSLVGSALWYVRHVVREARALGMWPSSADLEAEARQAA